MKSNDLALWYLRLNGFLTVPNFVLHPSRRRSQRTDADIVGVRFPHRTESHSDEDDQRFAKRSNKLYFVIAESTNNICKINDPWTKAATFEYVLRAFGVVPSPLIPAIAACLAETGSYSGERIDCGLLCFGSSEDATIKSRYPDVDQIRWRDVVYFFYRRFTTYDRLKRDHPQWDLAGTKLWDLWKESQKDEKRLWSLVCQKCGL